MANMTTGIVEVGGLADLIPLTNGTAGTWNHAQGVKAKKVTVLDAAGDIQDSTSVTVTQPDANNIVITNNVVGNNNVWALVEWEVGTIGKAGEVAASAVTVA